MKKSLLIGSVLFLGLTAANAQNIIFEDDFESYDDFIYENVGDWTLVSEDGNSDNTGFADVTFPNQDVMTSWIVFNPLNTTPPIDDITAYDWNFTAQNGEKYMLAKFSFQGPNKDWLISPQIELPADGVLNWQFKVKAPSGFFPNESFKVLVSTTDTDLSSFTEIGSEVTAVAKEWITYDYDLNAYAGENVYLAVEYTSDNIFALLVDDFLVTQEVTAGTNDISLKNLYIYPNPVKEEFNIVYPEGKFNTADLKIKISDLSGRTVMEFGAQNQYNISNLSKGVYVVEATDGKQTMSGRIIKK
ncbi:MAG: choice-of-anchor J domain-containing protein [Moheibacter sp.]